MNHAAKPCGDLAKRQSEAAREKTIQPITGRARASARVQAAATRRQQNRHSKRCKKRETGVAA